MKLAGPAVSRPWINERLPHAIARRAIEAFKRAHFVPETMTAPVRRMPSGRDVITSQAARRRVASVDVSQPNVTGLNPWWSYEEGAIPGVGRYMVNLWQQNLLVQADDVDVHHRGIDLAFRRTYNSASGHDYAGSDGSAEIGQFGNGWTNTFDAHVAQNSSSGISVYDIDGGRYDYSYDANGNFVAPPGMEGTSLVSDDGAEFFWTKKNGTQYAFYAPYYTGTYAGYSGRLYRISARNRNDYLQFAYSWDNADASLDANLSQISVTTENGLQQVVLQFADFSGRRLCSWLRFPDGTSYTWYGYDGAGNLTAVSHMPNGSNGGAYRTDGYGGYGPGGSLWTTDPRWYASSGAEGGYVVFGMSSGSERVASITFGGVVNFTPADGTNTPLQTGVATGAVSYAWTNFTSTAGSTQITDSDGHSYQQYYDSVGRPTSRYAYTGSQWLSSAEAWDLHNNRVADIDARGNETDYAYDAYNNTIAVAEPQATTSQGTFRPTKLYDYDAYHNVTAYCDPVATHQAGADWTALPGASDTLCSTAAVSVPHERFTFAYPSYQPYGELTAMTSALNYTRRIAYDTTMQYDGDHGQPTSVTGDAIVQADGTTITPTRTFWYDASGDMRCYNNGSGTWNSAYDALGHLTTAADPDDTSANGGALCGKTSGQAGWNTQTTYTYNPDGSKASSQTPEERRAGLATSYTYDADGDVTTETRHYGCSSANPCTGGVTTKWYDGADRLVEVRLPQDSVDWYPFAWLTRYLYDLTIGGSVAITGTTYRAYGNLYKTQEWLSPNWIDLRGTAFDALDRGVARYSFSPSTQYTVRTSTSTYDATAATKGLLSSTADPLGETSTYGYDAVGRPASVQFGSDGATTPDRSITYDPNGRPATVISQMLGTERRTYDAEGRLIELDEFTGGSVPIGSPAQIRYAYLGNGWRKSMSVASTAVTADPLMTYLYRSDGTRAKLTVTKSGTSSSFAWTYTDAGRVLTQSDPYTGSVIAATYQPVVAGQTYRNASYQYDASGVLSNVTLPVNGNYVVQRDAEGVPLAYNAVVPTSNGQKILSGSFHVTSRGETTGLSATYPAGGSSATTASVWSSFAANGYLGRTDAQGSVSFDWRNGVTLAPSLTQIPSNCSVNYPNSGYTYDALGRRTAAVSTQADADTCDNIGWSSTTAYDAESHTTSFVSYDAGGNGDAMTGNSNCPTVRSNPAGQPISMSCPGTTTLHYDGDQLLFVSGSNGSLTALDVETCGMLLSNNTILVNDRDYTGLTVMQHGSSGYSPWDSWVSAVRGKQTLTIGEQVPGSAGPTAKPAGDEVRELFNYTHQDGFESPIGMVQGVRVSDKDGWTTPDPYAGDVHDPTSQKSYMWNGNNPYVYSDPTGFKAQPIPIHLTPHELNLAAEGFHEIWNFMIGDDLHTVQDAHASIGARVFAGAMVATNVIPWGKVSGLTTKFLAAKLVGSANKVGRTGNDLSHLLSPHADFLTNPLIRQNAAKFGTWFSLNNGAQLIQAEGALNGKTGIFEWILDAKGNITHERFIENGKITGAPNQKV